MNHRGWKRLLLCCFVGAVVWLVVLPWIARQDHVRSMIERNEAAGIDPSAMFYSDLEHLSYQRGMLRRSTP